MCDPMTMTIATAGLAIAGGGISAAGAMHSGEQQARSYEDQADFADRQATMERQSGAHESARLKTQNDRTLGGIRHQYISSGVDASKGSAREVIEDSAREAALDEEAVLFGAKVRADNQRFSAKLARNNAGAARTGGMFDAASAIIGGLGQAAGGFSRTTMMSNPYQAYGAGGIY